MWQFISANAASLTVVATGVTLIVWTVYGQLMAANQVRQQKPRLFLKQGNGTGFDSVCLLSNMGHEFVYLRGVFLDLYTAEGERHTALVEKEWQQEATACTAEDIGQGPVESSQQLALGPFKWLVQEAARKAGLSDRQADDDILWRQLKSFAVTAIVTVGPYERTIGAERSFYIDASAGTLVPGPRGTLLRRSRRDAKSLQRYLMTQTEMDA